MVTDNMTSVLDEAGQPKPGSQDAWSPGFNIRVTIVLLGPTILQIIAGDTIVTL